MRNKILNIICEEFDSIDSKSISHNGIYRPAMLLCETINACNNNCIVCAYGIMTRKKHLMSIQVFKKVIADYAEMGGGCLSLTPVVGEVFMDKYLAERIHIARNISSIKHISFTTNAVMASDMAPEELHRIVNGVDKILISIYGCDDDEYSLMARTKNYNKMINGIKKIVSVAINTRIEIGFRLLKNRTDDELVHWMINNVDFSLPFTKVVSYANWNFLDTTVRLPYDAKWIDLKQNYERCLIPLVGIQVFSNGDVSFCPCDDFDSCKEFHLGNVYKESLLQMCKSEKYLNLIDKSAGLPEYCRNCTFHVPISNLRQNPSPILNPTEFIGG